MATRCALHPRGPAFPNPPVLGPFPRSRAPPTARGCAASRHHPARPPTPPQIPLLVNKIWSAKTQLPYSYYSLPFCRPEKVETERENIGQVLVGDRIQSSDYKVRGPPPSFAWLPALPPPPP
jgi:hypothetical protein